MSIHDHYGLSHIINAAGSFTPLGVSRSSTGVAHATGAALTPFFVIDQLQDALSAAISRSTGAEAAVAVHCVAAGITLSIVASMTGEDPVRIASLPNTHGMPNRVVIPAGHAVNYGHPIEQDIRLAGATPLFAGTIDQCSAQDIRLALAHPEVACLLLVSSRLVQGEPVDLQQAVTEAHSRGVPAIVDGAAQDLRIDELLATGADLVLVSAHKYLAAPTAGPGWHAVFQSISSRRLRLGPPQRQCSGKCFTSRATIDLGDGTTLGQVRARIGTRPAS